MNQCAITSSVLQELNLIRDIESREGISMPLPKFFYVQRYGRKVQDQMQEILRAVDRKEWFLFRTKDDFQEAGLCRNFKTELSKYAATGKEFEGCILIELSKDTLLSEGFTEFMEFLKEQENRLYYIFTTRKFKDAVSIQKCIEQYFFIRTVNAGDYSVEEQLAMIQEICEKCGFGMDTKAHSLLINGLRSKEWREDDYVIRRLQNEIYTVIYETALEGKCKDRRFSSEMAWQLLENLQKGNAEEMTFGFHKREFEAV